MTLLEKRITMLSMVKQWRSSGMTRAKFAKKKNIPISTFGYWISRSKDFSENSDSIPDSSDFIPLSGNGFLPNEISREIRLQYPNGVSLAIPADMPIKDIKELIDF